MIDWTSGYVADIDYTYGYYGELNPLRMKILFLNLGLVAPKFGTACELGFGQGLSTNIHAAASTTSWYGTDFNPAQASFAQHLAGVANAGAKLYDEAFADFASRTDLPDFDFIGLHGIWSWISDENRAVIVDFIRRKLKVGGVLYISYNTMPGWAAFAPMRHLMTEHAKIIGAEGHGIVNRVNGALEFSEKLLATNPLYATTNPQIANRIKNMKDQNEHYLAHEYFNRDWDPMHFATMADWLAPAKLNYACSAHYVDHLEAVNLTPEQQVFLAEIPDVLFRESVRDFMMNQQFRRDYWVKGARKVSALEQVGGLRQQRVMLIVHRPDVSLKVTGALGEGSMNEAIYTPVLDLLADHQPKTIGQIEEALKDTGIAFAQVMQIFTVLIGAGHVAAVQDDAIIVAAKKHTDKLNAYILGKAAGNTDISYLASPVTGGGIRIERFQQLFLLAQSQGYAQHEWAGFVWKVLATQGQKLLKEGKPLESAEENMAELTVWTDTFIQKQLPIFKALQIA